MDNSQKGTLAKHLKSCVELRCTYASKVVTCSEIWICLFRGPGSLFPGTIMAYSAGPGRSFSGTIMAFIQRAAAGFFRLQLWHLFQGPRQGFFFFFFFWYIYGIYGIYSVGPGRPFSGTIMAFVAFIPRAPAEFFSGH